MVEADTVQGNTNTERKPDECFVIMPIAEVDGYPSGHFRHVYENIVAPACSLANVKPVRADDVKAANLIHLDILRKLIDAPIVVCDLSTRNPNVLFELGIRQAFDKPVVLIQEIGTPKIFDISPLRYLEYSKDMRYHEVIETQNKLRDAILATIEAEEDSGNVNSIVKLLALSESAKIPDLKGDKESVALEFLRAEMQQMRRIMESRFQSDRGSSKRDSIVSIEYERLTSIIDRLSTRNSRILPSERLSHIESAIADIVRLIKLAEGKAEQNFFSSLLEKAEVLRSQILKEMDEIPF
jgi:hypothetical protein